MHIVVTGATGFVGGALTAALLRADQRVTALVRDPSRARRQLATGVDAVAIDDASAVRTALAGAQAVVNLAGENLFTKRWTEERKRVLRDSRVATTQRLVDLLDGRKEPLEVFLSASAVGYYGDTGDRPVDERAPCGEGFAAELCRDWEAAAEKARPLARRVVLSRFGIILGDGGALGPLRKLFGLGLGGKLGSGDQWMPWIHHTDAIAALLLLLGRAPLLEHAPVLDGPVNVTAPAPVRNRDFTEAIGKALHRPTILPVPSFAMKLAMGERAEMLLGGQHVVPRKLTDAGFLYRHSEIFAAVEAALHPKPSAEAA